MSNRKVCQIVITAEAKEQSGGKVVQHSNDVARKPSLGRWLLYKGLKKVRETSVQVSVAGGGGEANSPGGGKPDEEPLLCVSDMCEEE